MTTQEAINTFNKEYDLIGATIATSLVQELTQQGHVATGALVRSVIAVTQEMLDGIETSISHLKYGVELNTGIPASKVPRGGSAEYSILLNNLIKWIRFKKLVHGASKEYRFARNIIRKAQKTGFPTPGAYKFTRNTRRTRWIDYTVSTYQVKWEQKIEVIYFDLANNYLDAKLKEIQLMFPDIVTLN